jgi:hypothetical protein
MRLQAVLFGSGTLCDLREVERLAYHRVFAEAGLPWVRDAGWQEVSRQPLFDTGERGSADMLETFVRHAGWRNTEDLGNLLRVVRRRFEAVRRELAADPACLDRRMLAIAQAAASAGLRLAGLMPCPEGDMLPAMLRAESHAAALAVLDLDASSVLSIESSAGGLEDAGELAIASAGKTAVLAEFAPAGIPDGDDVIATLSALHARGLASRMSFRHPHMALSA